MREVKVNVGDFLEKLGRTLFERPLATGAQSEEPPELAEIRLAVLDQVREKSYRAGGRKVFPFDWFAWSCAAWRRAATPSSPAASSASTWSRRSRRALADAGCRFPENLRVDVNATVGLPQPR